MSSSRTYRPTLVSGQPAAPASGAHRILADMEGRSSRATPAAERGAATVRQRPWPWKWLIAAALLTTLLVASLAVFRATSGRDSEPSAAVSPFAPLPAEPAITPDEPARGAAMIVDDPQPYAGAGASPATSAIPAADAGNAAAATADTRSEAAASAPRKATARPSSARRATADKVEGADLLSTLLGIIKQKDTAAAPQQHESMDVLVAEIQARDRRERAESDAVFDSMNRRSAASTSDSSVQAQLRRCPAANTLKGIDCRRRICAGLAGKDAACPAQ